MRYIKCRCGQSDGNDDTIVSQSLVSLSNNAKEAVVREIRVCDICGRSRSVLIHFSFNYEEADQ